MTGDAPLGTARPSVQGSVHAAAPSPLGSARACLEAMVSEQIAQEHARRSRADVEDAIARAERGEEAFLADLDPDDPASLALFERAYAAVLEERQRRDRVAAALLSTKPRCGR
jgi:hypothetical protein